MTKVKSTYKIIFIHQNTVYEIYARRVSQSNLLGFIEAEELIFGEKASVLIDPGEERLRAEFINVKRSYIPLHAIMRIDEVIKEGLPKIRELGDKSNISSFPSTIYTPSQVRT